MTAPSPLTDDQRKHLDFIQAVITRMSSSSSTVKGWALTVTLAAFGFAANQANPFIAVLGIVTVAFFGSLDAYYLRQERLFRFLFDDARRGHVEVYSMAKDIYRSQSTFWKSLRSGSVAGFYLPLAAFGVVTFWWTLCG